MSFFVYGTLQPHATAEWSSSFTKGAIATPAKCHYGTLYYDTSIEYPAVDLTRRNSNPIEGYLLRFDNFEKKLREADEIEEYPHVYLRDVIPVETVDGIQPAYIYHRVVEKGIPIQCGNWFQWVYYTTKEYS